MIHHDKKEWATLNLYQILLTHKRPMVWTFSGIMLVTIAVTVLGQKIYTSEAKLFVRLGRESVSLDPTATTGQVVMVNESRENEINSIFELLKSREILSNVVAALGAQVVLETGSAHDQIQTAGMFQSLRLNVPYSLDDEAIKRLAGGLKIAAVKKSNVINLSYEARSPELARDVVASVIEQAREAHGRVNRIQGSHEFFESQTNQLREKLARLETELLELKNSSGISSFQDQRTFKLQQITELQNSLLTVEANLVASSAEMRSQETALTKIPETITKGETTGMPHSPVAAMREQLFTLQVREKELLSNYKDAHPLAVLIRDQVTSLKAVLDKEPVQPQIEHGLNSVHQEISLAYLKGESSSASLKAQAAVLREQLSRAQQELTNLNRHEVEISRLEREIEMEAANYKKYADNLEQSRIDCELEVKNISNLNVLQPPTFSITPSRPRRSLNLAMGLMGALASSLGIGLLLEQRRSGLLSRLLWSAHATHPADSSGSVARGRIDRETLDKM